MSIENKKLYPISTDDIATSETPIETIEPTNDSETLYRNIDEITNDILTIKLQHSDSFMQIGRYLIEAKKQLRHGEWLIWLQDRVSFSERMAQLYIKLAKANLDAGILSDLGLTKANMLLSLPDNEREDFLNASHEINAKPIKLNQTTTKEFKNLIGKYKNNLKFPLGDWLNDNIEIDRRISCINEHYHEMKCHADVMLEQLTAIKNNCNYDDYINLSSQIRQLINDIQKRFPEIELVSTIESVS